MKIALIALACLTLALGNSGCLRTRAQLRDGGGNSGEASHSAPTPVQAQPIQEVPNESRYAIDEMRGEITRLNGRIEDLERANQQASQTSAAAKSEELKVLEKRIVELEQSQAAMLESMKKPQAQESSSAGSFEKGRSQYEAKDYAGAVESLTVYLKNPKAKHAEEATFFRGESNYHIGQFKNAILDFSKFPEKYSTSKKMHLALYRIGLSFEKLGMKEDAKGFYQELVDKFPKSAEAGKVRSKLK